MLELSDASLHFIRYSEILMVQSDTSNKSAILSKVCRPINTQVSMHVIPSGVARVLSLGGGVKLRAKRTKIVGPGACPRKIFLGHALQNVGKRPFLEKPS